MKRKIVSVLVATAFVTSMFAGCGNSGGSATIETVTEAASEVAEAADTAADAAADSAPAADSADGSADSDYHIGIVTGSVSQSEDDRRGAEAFQAKYGEDRVMLATYPDNFTEELET
nr:DUF3798 domain-containing protein [Lachnospiraceae bacterium]